MAWQWAQCLLRRSELDGNVWVPDYGADQSCFLQSAASLRKVKQWCESRVPLLENYAIPDGAPLKWVREDANTYALWFDDGLAAGPPISMLSPEPWEL